MVPRGAGARRLLVAAIVGVVGWEMLVRRENDGVIVFCVAMLLATFLAVPGMPGFRRTLPPPSSWPRRARTLRSGRGGMRGHDEIFR